MAQKKLEIQLYKKNPFLPLLQNDSIVNREQYLLDLDERFLSEMAKVSYTSNWCLPVKDRALHVTYTPILFSARPAYVLHMSNDFEASEKPSGVVLK